MPVRYKFSLTNPNNLIVFKIHIKTQKIKKNTFGCRVRRSKQAGDGIYFLLNYNI